MKTICLSLLLSITTLTVACGYSSKNVAATPGAVPNVTELSPDNVNAGGPELVVTVNGASFASDAAVKVNGQAEPTTFVGANQLMVTIPAAATATAGAATVTVTNPAHPGTGMYGGGTLAETSNTVTFTIN